MVVGFRSPVTVRGLTATVVLVMLTATGWPVAAQTPIRVTDDLGNSVVLGLPATRIISLAPHLTELLFSLGAGERIVGTVRFSDYPDAARDIPVLGDAFTVNIESILTRRPDLVVAWETGGTSRVVAKLVELGIPVYRNEARDIAGIARSTMALSRLVGDAALGDRLSARFLGRIEALRGRYQPSDVTVFFQISDQSLYTVSDRHLIGQALSVCGVRNVFGLSEIPVPVVSMESVLDANPDVIVISQPPGVESPWIGKWAEIGGLTGRIMTIDPNLISRPSLRMADGIESLCSLVR